MWIGKYGPGYKRSSQYQFEVFLLKAYKKLIKVRKRLKNHGIIDGWTDNEHESVMKLCMHCKKGASFIKSIENVVNA